MKLLSRIERHLRRSGTAPTMFGRITMGDPRFVHDLRCGRVPRRETIRRIGEWLDRHEEEPPAAADQLKRAIAADLADFAGTIDMEVESRGWASALFEGGQHRLTIRLDGPGAAAAADAFLEGIAEREFALDGHILADIVPVRDSRDADGLNVSLTLDALTVQSA